MDAAELRARAEAELEYAVRRQGGVMRPRELGTIAFLPTDVSRIGQLAEDVLAYLDQAERDNDH